MYNIYNNLMPSNILSYFCMVHMSHDHDTRQAGHFKNMYCRTTLKSMCLSIRGPVMWSKLHSDLKNSTTVNMFKKGIKPFWLVSIKQRNSALKLIYSSTCHERTPSGPGKSVRTLQVAAHQRDGWARCNESGHC